MSEVSHLLGRLKEMGARVCGFPLAPGANLTSEELAGELNRYLDALEKGECREVHPMELDIRHHFNAWQWEMVEALVDKVRAGAKA